MAISVFWQLGKFLHKAIDIVPATIIMISSGYRERPSLNTIKLVSVVVEGFGCSVNNDDVD